MSNVREPLLGVVVGRKSVGKTYTTMNKVIGPYLQGNISSGIKPRKVLILDVNDEYVGVKGLSVKDIRKFSASNIIEARRIRPISDDGKKVSLDEFTEFLNIALNDFKGGLMLIEDPNKYIQDNMPGDLIGLICTNRHSDLDIILHFQSFGRITPKVWQNLNYIRFHKNTDSVAKHADKKFEDKKAIMSIAEHIVNKKYANGDTRYYLYVDVDRMKINAPNLSKELKQEAIIFYISTDYTHLVKKRLNYEKVKNKNSNVSEEQIYKTVVEELTTTYF